MVQREGKEIIILFIQNSRGHRKPDSVFRRPFIDQNTLYNKGLTHERPPDDDHSSGTYVAIRLMRPTRHAYP